MPATEALSPATLAEARRTMEICNACRYCEGYCPVFPAMELRREFADGDLVHLANLCHNCKGCWHACQYAPPHEFGLNLPAVFADLRAESYAAHAWPRPLGRAFERNGFWIALATAAALSLVLLATLVLQDYGIVTAQHSGPGAFYRVIPHGAMAWLGGLSFGWAVLAILIGGVTYWRAAGVGWPRLSDIGGALRDAATTRHLGGGGRDSGPGEGCNDIDERYGLGRRHMHLATMWGFLLCFASTSVATLMHYGLGWVAPYSWYSLPVVLGTVGGIGLAAGTAGLFWIKMRTDRAPEAVNRWGMDLGLIALLNLVAVTGLALLFWRHTSAMGWLLAIHLGVVLGFFGTLPYGKMVHGLYRGLALIRHNAEMRSGVETGRR